MDKTNDAPANVSDNPAAPEQSSQSEQKTATPLNPGAGSVYATGRQLGDQYQETAFLVDDTFYRSRVPKSQHWSIVWSDLMMTMFILFLTMFAYQAAHETFLVKKTPEIVGGSTTDAMDITAPVTKASLPFSPIDRGIPLITGGTIKKVETVTGEAMTPEEEKKIPRFDVLSQPDKTGGGDQDSSATSTSDVSADETSPPGQKAPDTPVATAPLDAIYDLSQEALTKNNLKKFASIDLIPDTTMRIILTGDLLFNTGKADLSPTARQSLQKVVTAIKDTPYMINVIGHTDNLPMNSERFTTNWELSVARASTVARFLIEETGMNPNQFVVSGYSSFRPIRPNTTAENRAMNRRVEIIISKKLPPAEQATSENLKKL